MDHSSNPPDTNLGLAGDAVKPLPLRDRIKVFLDGYPKWKEGVFLTSVTGISMLVGFGVTVASAKKQGSEPLEKMKEGMSVAKRLENGTALAVRALKWGTFYAFAGCGLLFFGIWKMMGVKDLKEFRQKAGEVLPRIPKNESGGRTEFENLTDLLQYIVDEDNRAKMEKQQAIENANSHNSSSHSSRNRITSENIQPNHNSVVEGEFDLTELKS